MTLNPAHVLVAALATLASAGAQTKATTHTATRRPAQKTAAKPAAPACEPVSGLSATIPAAPGCPGTLYALRFLDTSVGTGAEVTPRKWLTVAYTGYLVDGTKFDTSIGKDPITFPYGAHQVIAGWDTGFEGMHIGGKRRLYIPYELAYGEAGRPPVIPAKAMLVFDVELIAISDNPPAPKAPPPPPAKPGEPAKPQADPATNPAKPEPDAAQSKPQTSPKPEAATADPTKPAAASPKP